VRSTDVAWQKGLDFRVTDGRNVIVARHERLRRPDVYVCQGGRLLAVSTRLRLFHLFHFSKPASDRAVYQAIYGRRIQRIVELGVRTGQRALRLIQVASQHLSPEQITYIGIDPFESRSVADGPGLSLKQAYRLLRATGTRIRLIPGDPLAIFSTAANDLGVADLVLLGWPIQRSFLPHACYYLRRILHDGSLVLLEDVAQADETKRIKVLPLDRIRAWSDAFRRAA